MIKFSVIVPVYNTEQFLNRCLDSILAYRGDELEVIALDDGSTDRSLEVLQGYRDARLKVVHKQNEGVFKTWKRGVSLASGEYIVFVDSDDSVDERLFPVLNGILDGSDYDLVQFSWTIFGGDVKKPTVEEPYPEFPQGPYVGDSLEKYRDACVFRNEDPEKYATARARWGKAFRAEKLKALLPRLMENVGLFEDDSAVIPYLAEMRSLYLLREPLYFYMIGRAGSICNSFERVESYLRDAAAVCDFLSSSDFAIPHETVDRFYRYYHRFVLWLAVLSKQDALAAKIVDDERFRALLGESGSFKDGLLLKKRFGTYRFMRKLKHLFRK